MKSRVRASCGHLTRALPVWPRRMPGIELRCVPNVSPACRRVFKSPIVLPHLVLAGSADSDQRCMCAPRWNVRLCVMLRFRTESVRCTCGVPFHNVPGLQSAWRGPPSLGQSIIQDFVWCWFVVPHGDSCDRAQSRCVEDQKNTSIQQHSDVVSEFILNHHIRQGILSSQGRKPTHDV